MPILQKACASAGATDDLCIRFWGVRGSRPSSSEATVRYGGATACIEVCAENHRERLIIDAGTGIVELGETWAQETVNVLFTHFHWDHLQGLPFFQPLYDPSMTIEFHSVLPGAQLEKVLSEQMRAPFFPIDFRSTLSAKKYNQLSLQEQSIGPFQVCPVVLNHPNGCHGYRIRIGPNSVLIASDHEHGAKQIDQNLRTIARSCHVMIYDAHYTPLEYERRRGWGHSTWEAATQLAHEAEVTSLILFHHDPERSDIDLDEIKACAARRFPETYVAGQRVNLYIRNGCVSFAGRVQ